MKNFLYVGLGMILGIWLLIGLLLIVPHKTIVSPSPWVEEKGKPWTLESYAVNDEIVLMPEWKKEEPQHESLETTLAIQDIEIQLAKEYFNSPGGRCPFSGRWK